MENVSTIKNIVRHIKHWFVVKFTPRTNRVYTQFNRFPHQYRALVERVIPGLMAPQNKRLEILVFGCCSGAEPVSLASVIQQHFPQLDFRIRGFDIVASAIGRAKNPLYTEDEIRQGPFVDEDFIAHTFVKEGAHYRVRDELMQRLEFAVGDMLDAQFMQSLGKADLVFAQNVLFHLPTPRARQAFVNLHGLLNPGSALFVNGMDTDMRVRLTKRFALAPLEYLIEEIHNDARVDRGNSWAGAYWGRKPFSRKSSEWIREHCTIYHKADV